MADSHQGVAASVIHRCSDRSKAWFWGAERGFAIAKEPITGMADCCARATIGHVAAPPSAAMNARRRIDPSRE
jgi:hypothetical protein